MSKFKKVIEVNKDTIIGSICLVGIAFVCKKFGISFNPFNFSKRDYIYRDTQNNDIETIWNKFLEDYYKPQEKERWVARNSVETSIAILANNTKNMSLESTKLTAAKQIMEIISDNKSTIDDETKTFAIVALRAILPRLTLDSSKNDISRMIKNIAINNF